MCLLIVQLFPRSLLMPSTFMRRDDRQNDCRQVRTVVELLPRRKRRKGNHNLTVSFM